MSWEVVRVVFASFGLVLAVLALCLWIMKPRKWRSLAVELVGASLCLSGFYLATGHFGDIAIVLVGIGIGTTLTATTAPLWASRSDVAPDAEASEPTV